MRRMIGLIGCVWVIGCAGEMEENSIRDAEVGGTNVVVSSQDMSRTQTASTSQPSTSKPVPSRDMGQVSQEDMSTGEVTMDQGSATPDLEEADQGKPPEYKPGEPIKVIRPFEQLSPTQAVEWLDYPNWNPRENTLMFASCANGRKTQKDILVEKYGDPVPKDKVVSSWTSRTYDPSTSPAQVSHKYTFPVQSTKEPHEWCKYSISREQTWCFSYYGKQAARFMRVDGGNGLDKPLDLKHWNAHPYLTTSEDSQVGFQHEHLQDLVERSDGTFFWTFSRNVGRAKDAQVLYKGSIFYSTKDAPEKLVLALPNHPSMVHEQGASSQIMGVTLSLDEKTLYFSTRGSKKAPELGGVWAATIKEDNTLAVPVQIVSGLYQAKGLTTDETGNIYVAHQSNVNVYGPDGGLIETLRVKPEGFPGDFVVSGVAFGGKFGNILYATLGYYQSSFLSTPERTIKEGGLFGAELNVRGLWAVQFPDVAKESQK